MAVWGLMGLTNDISRVKTHFLAITLRGTKSSNPRTMYQLIEIEVLPIQALKDIYLKRSNLVEGPKNPIELHEKDTLEDIAKGGLGPALVLLTELPPGDDRPPHEAIKIMAVHLRAITSRFEAENPMLPKEYALECIRNSLAGGQYAIEFKPHEAALTNAPAPEHPTGVDYVEAIGAVTLTPMPTYCMLICMINR
ncbi:hypothetical protein BV25DRAFT_629422 [Artomyces pyxidatus]|uniref:Uncharacterized protein n=1 Tax=Artomyces pyxidatus TaxID=48021 RepID=A0ACB8T2R4_9AGAM|nr:hypothetical protein BV25DRAFT_629422 [Artomyces pyxidatus]